MSVLVVTPRGPTGRAVVKRLVDEGDEVGVIVEDALETPTWRELGAYVAVGSPEDSDLIERAAQHARSVVLFDAPSRVLTAVVEGIRMVGDSARLILCLPRRNADGQEVKQSGLEYVILRTPGRRGLPIGGARELAAAMLAEAVSAADDLDGEQRLEVDLGAAEERRSLGIRG